MVTPIVRVRLLAPRATAGAAAGATANTTADATAGAIAGAAASGDVGATTDANANIAPKGYLGTATLSARNLGTTSALPRASRLQYGRTGGLVKNTHSGSLGKDYQFQCVLRHLVLTLQNMSALPTHRWQNLLVTRNWHMVQKLQPLQVHAKSAQEADQKEGRFDQQQCCCIVASAAGGCRCKVFWFLQWHTCQDAWPRLEKQKLKLVLSLSAM